MKKEEQGGLIDRGALLAAYDAMHKGEPGRARKLIEDAPTVDAVRVVRCKDCVFWLRDKEHSLNGECECDCIDGWWLPEEYCACGERRDADES